MVNSCMLSGGAPISTPGISGLSEVIVNITICSPSKRLSSATLKFIQFSGGLGERSTELENP